MTMTVLAEDGAVCTPVTPPSTTVKVAVVKSGVMLDTQAKPLAEPASTIPLTERMLLKSGWPRAVPVLVRTAVATA